jgi:hypothetical protein
MSVSLITGKSATFTYDSVQGEAQITAFTTEESSESESIETLAGTAVLTASKAYTATISFLFDGNTTGGGFYKAMQAAFADGLPGTITLAIGTYSETGSGTVTALSKEVPADGGVTCEATVVCTGMTPTYPAS